MKNSAFPAWCISLAVIVLVSCPFMRSPESRACVGTNEPWHEFTLREGEAQSYLDTGYFKVYGPEEGLADRSVTCLAQSERHRLVYIGTKSSGVFIFDGKSVRPLSPSAGWPSGNVLSICYNERTDCLAVGTNSGLVMVFSPKAESASGLTVIGTKNGAQSNTVLSLVPFGQGFAAGTDHGIFLVAGSSVTRVASRSQENLELGIVTALGADRSGQIFLGTDTDLHCTLDGERFEKASWARPESLKGITRAGLVRVPRPQPKTAKAVRQAEEEAWAMAYSSVTGLHIAEGASGQTTINSSNGLSEDWVTCFGYDSLGTDTRTTVSIGAGVLDPDPASGTEETAVEREALIKKLLSLDLPGTRVTREGGNIIVRTQDPGALLSNPTFSAINDVLHIFAPASPAPSKPVPGLESIRKGLWAGTKNSGVCVFNGSGFVAFNKENSPMMSNQVTDILSTKNFVYVGTDGGGLLRYGKYDSPETGTGFDKISSMAPNFIRAVGSDAFIGTEKGLFKYSSSGELSEVLKGEPALRNAYGLCVDSVGELAVATHSHGVTFIGSVKKPDGSVGPGIAKIVGRDDGAPSNRCTAVHAVEKKGVMAGFGDACDTLSRKCVIIGPDRTVQRFDPPQGADPRAYDSTSQARNWPAAFLDVADGYFIGSSAGDSCALAFYSGPSWDYVRTNSSASIGRVNTIGRIAGRGLCVSGDFGVMVFDGRNWERVSHVAGVTIGDSVAAYRDTMADGIWILTSSAKPSAEGKKQCALVYRGANRTSSVLVPGQGRAMAQIDPYVIVGTSEGVFKINKSR